MDINKFLSDLLASQDLSRDQEYSLEAHKGEVTAFIRQEFGDKPVIKYAGSHAKGTAISDCYDLDVVCYFPNSESRTLKEIRDDVAAHLATRYLIDHKRSAERILSLKGATTPNTYHVDVVPGRFIPESKDVFIHLAEGDQERMQTNLKTHIDHIAGSGCVDVIRLVKLWSVRNNISIKTFVLELFVIRALEGSANKGDLKAAFLEVIEAFKDRFGSVQLVDPANTNNIVSQLIDPAHVAEVRVAAENTASRIAYSENAEDWQEAFGENNAAASATAQASPTIIRNPSGPWAQS